MRGWRVASLGRRRPDLLLRGQWAFPLVPSRPQLAHSLLPCPALPSLSPCPADAGIRQIYLEGTVQPILHRAKMAKPKGLCTQSHKYSKQLRLQKRTVPDPLDSGFPSPRPEEDSTNLSLSRGVLASAGRQMMTCISFGRSWQSQVI